MLLLLAACRTETTDGEPTATAETGTPSAAHSATTPIGPVDAVLDELCAPRESLGTVRLTVNDGYPSTVEAQLWDRPDPWLGPPVATTATCAYHRFSPDACGTCPHGQTCGYDGGCVPERRARTGARLVVGDGTSERTFDADAVTGQLWGQLDLGGPDADWELTLTLGGAELRVPPTRATLDPLAGAVVTIEGDYMVPGALDATWPAPADGGHVTSRIPINHHAAGPTFTDCVAPAADGGFHADAEMVDPLAVSTGLEFQGLEHVRVASARLPEGCVEFRLGRRIWVGVTPP
ncbi:MAG: hypothetical protein H6738_11080 [Alphaproteobacteria bacterium]|nr:hypothetical protein [Alphaproteobacteria bacterium]MCB9697313.1 hypothetical protein [Alphaproteobacteria bacterium]